jgi:5-hydroxyisourate hydrolase
MKPAALTTHVLDTARGVPAAGVVVELWRLDPVPALVVRMVTNADGRTDAPLLSGAAFVAGRYELRFQIGAYFAAAGAEAGFLDEVPLRVVLRADAGHYHVPLLCSPWSYATYRGS